MVGSDIAVNLVAVGDGRLLRLMLYQLIANSWKFTASCVSARIEIGEYVLDSRATFYVRDNGVGFDPLYPSKLFIPFQRLHDASEFAGSGIGLAIADRVACRHGGRMWAESLPDQGSVFFFTLEPPPDVRNESTADE